MVFIIIQMNQMLSEWFQTYYPRLKFGDIVDPKKNIREEKDKKESLEDIFYHLQKRAMLNICF